MMFGRLFALALTVLNATAHAAEPQPRQFADWARAACLKAEKLDEVVYEKGGGGPRRFAKFDWQQLRCFQELDTSGQAPTGVVSYVFALRRSDYVDSAAAAQRQGVSTGLGAVGYQLYYREIDGRWQPVAYRMLGSNYETIQAADLSPRPLQLFSDAQAVRALGAVSTRAMSPLLQVSANSACSSAQGVDVICERRQ